MRIGLLLSIVGVTATLPLVQAGWAEPGSEKSATYWLRKCTSPEAYGPMECAGYVRALVEYDRLRAELGETRQICAEKGVTLGQSRDAVVKYLRDHPAEGHLPFVSLAHAALKDAYPCPAEPRK